MTLGRAEVEGIAAGLESQVARLTRDLEAARAELEEVRQQQAASAEVLRVISRSAFDVTAVLQTLVESAIRLCGADMGAITLREGETLRFKAGSAQTPELLEYERANPHPIGRGTFQGRAALAGRTIHVPDVLADAEYERKEAAFIGNFRSVLSVPLKRGEEVVGVFGMARRSVGPFPQHLIELVERFADKAVIALENARLFEEVQSRNREIAEALEQQTATAEVLRVIASSPTDVRPVLDSVVVSAAKLCEAYDAIIALREGEALRISAHCGPVPVDFATAPLTRGWVAGRSVLDRTTVQVADLSREGDDYAIGREMAMRLGHRTTLATPLILQGEAIGTLVLRRFEVRPFSDKQVELLKTFADQAVIAIDNARLFEEVQARNREVSEALEQQTATGEILKVIAASPTDIRPVLQVVVESATRFCDTYDAAIFLERDGKLEPKAHHGPIPMDLPPLPIGRDWVSGRCFLERRTVVVEDLLAEGDEFPLGQQLSARLGHRTLAATPLMRNEQPIGALVIRRQEVRPFSEKQIRLLNTFADQAVIAIQNVRLFEEVQARSIELREALTRQTATADVLKLISRSTFDLGAVLGALAVSASGLCSADNASIVIRQANGAFVEAANHGYSDAFARHMQDFHYQPDRSTCTGRVLLEGRTIQIPDALADPEYRLLDGLGGAEFRSVLGVPLLREGVPIGVFVLTRAQVNPFSDKQIEVIQTFADQAVIAIENVRLFEEVEARNREVSEALQQQTATGDILRVIASSPTDIQPVLEVIAESTARYCDTPDVNILLEQDGLLSIRAHYGPIPPRLIPEPASRDWVSGRAFIERRAVNVPDLLAADDEFPRGRAMVEKSGIRSMAAVPLMQDQQAIGAIAVRRTEVRPFTEQQMSLLRTFADQAVIAIQNVRLFDEVQARNREISEALQQQTATAEVLDVISRSMVNAQPVFDAILENAARICDASFGNLALRDGESLRHVAAYGATPEWEEFRLRHPILRPGPKTALGQVIASRSHVHVDDAMDDRAFREGDPLRVKMVELFGARTILSVPMLKDGEVVGAITIHRKEVRPFSDKQIALLGSFASQAVIAVENARLVASLQSRTAELDEALQQQTATADVLKVISRSAFDLQSVLQTLIDSAARLCDSNGSGIFLPDGDVLRIAASYSNSPEYDAYERAHPSPMSRASWVGRAALEKTIVHVPDVSKDAEHGAPEAPLLGGYRSVLCVPLLRHGAVVGVFALSRPQVGPFTDRQIELVKTFADQAVIAIENVRLFEQVQARTAELSEALQQQTATADVLKVISRSAFDLQAVLSTLVESASHICEAEAGAIFQSRANLFQMTAQFGFSKDYESYATANPLTVNTDSTTGRVVLSGKTVHIPDVLADPAYKVIGHQRYGHYRTSLGVPLLSKGTVVGVFVLTRPEVKPFTRKQIELVETFADQAVIAIENVRLFDEVQARTAELTEALQQQTATADVLKVISRSAFDLQVVLDTLTESAVRLCRADKGALERMTDGGLQYVAMHGFPAGFREYAEAHPTELGRGSAVGRAIEEHRIIQIKDIEEDSEYTHGGVAAAGGMRTVLAVPLFRHDELIGVFALIRTKPLPFSDREIELVKTFADQAVIAIENVRLFDEVQARTAELSEALQQQTATADVLKVISRSAFDLQTVLETLVQSAVRLCNAAHGAVFRRQGDVYRFAAGYAVKPEVERLERQLLVQPSRGTAIGRAVLERQVVQIADALTDPEYDNPDIAKLDNLRTILGVPLLGQDGPIGAFGLGRHWVEPFTEREIELVRTFADQAVIAIENVRLFEQVQARTRELEESLRELRTAQDRLVQTEKLASLGQLTAGIAHEIKNPLNFVNNFASLSNDLLTELTDVLDRAELGGSLRAEVDELTGLLKGNLAKVEQHGKRADSIVKNMLLHSRQGSGEHRPTNINAVVEESLNLAYHGARAEKQGFNIRLERDLDPGAGEVDLYPQEITRVLLNLISNGFYATEKRAAQADGVYEPVLAAATKDLGHSVEITIRDNGTGIPEEVKERMFAPFFTTKPAGEGTGLGLSLSHDIVVKQHAGTIEVATEPGAFTEFRIVLPRSAASLGQKGETA